MSDITSEISVADYPLIVSIEGIEIIDKQMKNNVCKIYTNKGHGTGFICKFLYKNETIKVLITCNHVLGKEELNVGKTIKFSFNEEKKPKRIRIDKDRKIFTDHLLDTTIIQIKDEDKIDENYLELDENILKKDCIYESYVKQPIYILEIPDNKMYASFGIVDYINKDIIVHKCSTNAGASGSPILSLSNNKIIGVHRGGKEKKEANIGILLYKSLEEFKKLIKKKKINDIQINNNLKKQNEIKDFVMVYDNENFPKREIPRNNNFRNSNAINTNNSQRKN